MPESSPHSERLAEIKRKHVACDCLWPEIERLEEQLEAALKTGLKR